MSNVVIKVSESEVKLDKNGRKYKTVGFGEVKYIDTPFGKMLVPSTQARTTKTNCYELNYLGKQDSGYVDALFNAANPTNGGWFMGSIETREVKAYDITAADGTNAFVSFNLTSSAIRVVSGSKYTMQLTTPSVTVGWLDLHTGNVYAGGRGGNDPTWDYLFRTYIKAITVEPYLTASSIGGANFASESKEDFIQLSIDEVRQIIKILKQSHFEISLSFEAKVLRDSSM